MGETHVPMTPPILLGSQRCRQDIKLEDTTSLTQLVSADRMGLKPAAEMVPVAGPWLPGTRAI